MLRWQDLVHYSDEELGKLDIAEVNLACAAGMPDAPTQADVSECLKRLDQMAAAFPSYVKKRQYAYYKDPSQYNGSLRLFRTVQMLLLVRESGVRYNPHKIPREVPFDTADTFIHGALLGAGGTCATLPVVYAAVGRRLGLPIKLALAPGHVFCRLDAPDGERVNLECNESGVSSPPDEHFKTGMFAAPERIFQLGQLLRSLTPRQELSNFLIQRGHRFQQRKAFYEACDAFIWGGFLVPDDVLTHSCVKRALDAWGVELDALRFRGFPSFGVNFPPRRFPECIPLVVERRAIFYEYLEKCLKDEGNEKRWFGPFRRGEKVQMPSTITVTVKN